MASYGSEWQDGEQEIDLPVPGQGSRGDRQAIRAKHHKVSENALIGAIRRLEGTKPENGLNGQADSEGRGRDSNPGASLLATFLP